ncbi:MAG: cyclic pyranopterin monophosphate synthase MoaC [Saprospiraceae bacterium]
MKLTHINKDGLPGMVDVSAKSHTVRVAQASGKILLGKKIMKALAEYDYETKKGSIQQTAIIAATMAVKKTYETIPLCHQIPISSIKVIIDPTKDGFDIRCIAKSSGQTGIEMEVLNGVSVAALTIYDMCKAMSQQMKITNIQLDIKEGGKNDYHRKA